MIFVVIASIIYGVIGYGAFKCIEHTVGEMDFLHQCIVLAGWPLILFILGFVTFAIDITEE